MGKLALVFPGQGSQEVGMGRSVARELKAAAAVFEAADSALGEPLTRLCWEGPLEELTLTANAQPAILTASIAILRALRERMSLEPAFVAGHSLGEYSALVASGALELGDAVRVTRRRGQLMQEAVPAGEGAMAAILGMERVAIDEICAAASQGEVVSAANFNAPGQIAIAGHRGAVERACARVADEGGRAIPLKVSAPFHCALMRPAAHGLAALLERIAIHRPSVPIVANVTAAPTHDPEQIRELLVRQVDAPVRWEDCVRTMVASGVTTLVEVGPGSVLASLAKRIDKSVRCLSVSEIDDVQKLAAEGV